MLCDVPGVLSEDGFWVLLLDALRISGSGGQRPGHSRLHRINPLLTKEIDSALNQYFAAGLVEHSISPYSSPLVVISKKFGGVRITVNYKKLNNFASLANCRSAAWTRSWTP